MEKFYTQALIDSCYWDMDIDSFKVTLKAVEPFLFYTLDESGRKRYFNMFLPETLDVSGGSGNCLLLSTSTGFFVNNNINLDNILTLSRSNVLLKVFIVANAIEENVSANSQQYSKYRITAIEFKGL